MISNGRMSTNFVLRIDCDSEGPVSHGGSWLVFVCGGGQGGGGKGEFEQTIPDQAGERPTCFVLVFM